MLSVIITCRNTEKYIRQCVDSVLAQDCGEKEVILVSDDSRDPVCQIMAEYRAANPNVVQLVIRDNSHMAGGARNMGLQEAGGDFVSFVDGDDWISQGMYAALLAEFHDQQVDMACCNYNEFYTEDGRVMPRMLWPGAKKKSTIESYKASELFVKASYCWNLIYRRSLLDRIKFGFFEDTIYDDLACHVAFAASRKISYLPVPYYWHRKYPLSTIESASTEKHCTIIDATRRLVLRMRELGLYEVFSVEMNELLQTYLFRYMHYLMLRGSVDISPSILRQCAKVFEELGGELDPNDNDCILYSRQMHDPLSVAGILKNGTITKETSWRGKVDN